MISKRTNFHSTCSVLPCSLDQLTHQPKAASPQVHMCGTDRPLTYKFILFNASTVRLHSHMLFSVLQRFLFYFIWRTLKYNNNTLYKLYLNCVWQFTGSFQIIQTSKPKRRPLWLHGCSLCELITKTAKQKTSL